MSADDGGPMMIDCDEHGRSVSAVVCRHHIDSLEPVGFIENTDDPDDLQAWCSACEERFLEEGELTTRSAGSTSSRSSASAATGSSSAVTPPPRPDVRG